MSEKADPKELESTGERRRRRKRGGLRVPSDNVPRRNSKVEETPAPPEPEDPRLAVSVAYAFGANGEGEEAKSNGEGDAVPEATPEAADTEVMAAADTLPPPSAPEPAAVEAVPEAVGSEPVAEAVPEAVPAAPSVPEPPRAALPKPKKPGGKRKVTDASKTVEMPAVQLEALGLAASGDSVDIAFDEDADDEPTAVAVPIPKPDTPPQEVPPLFTTTGAALPPPSASEEPAAPKLATPKPAADAPSGKQTRAAPVRTRAPTMALSEEDLEEVRAIAMEEGIDDLPELEKKQPEVPDDVRSTTPFGIPVVKADQPSGAVESPAPTAISEAPTAPRAATDPAAVAPAPDGASAPEPFADAGDSGEIITDDLIEEVGDVAQPVPVSQTAPPPAPEHAEAAPAPVEPSKPPPAPPKPPPAPSKPKGDVARAAGSQTASPKGRSRKGKPWFEEIFEEDYLRTLPFLTPQATQAEAQLVAESLELKPGSQVLDVGCGYGRHAMELAARGVHVVALDSSLPLLLRGADEAQRRGLDINFVHGDMRELTFENQFDGAYCLFSTFGYFDDETNKQAALNIARALKPGGKFVVEILNRDYIIGDLPSRVWWEGDGCVVLEEVDFNYFSSRVISHRSVVFDDGRQLEQEISLRSYSLHEFGKLLHAAGFRVLEVSGGHATRGRFFGNQSRDIIVLAERRNTLPS